jgi:hypothetical protein
MITEETKNKLRKVAQVIYDEFGKTDSVWVDGFINYLLHGHTDSDDGNSYLPQEEPWHSEYKSGARAAMALEASLGREGLR